LAEIALINVWILFILYHCW